MKELLKDNKDDNCTFLKDGINEVITAYIQDDDFPKDRARKRRYLTNLEIDIVEKIDDFNDKINDLKTYYKQLIAENK